MAFDPIANGWRKLLKNGGAGYTEVTEKICRSNGNQYSRWFDGALLGMEGTKFIRPFGEMPTNKSIKIKSMTTSRTDYETFNDTVTYTEEHLVIEKEEDALVCRSDNNSDINFAVIIYKDITLDESTTIYAGLYFLLAEQPDCSTFVSELVYEEETVHTIDPKYISGVILPVVTLSIDTIMAAYSNEKLEAVVNEREAAELRKAKDCGLPFVIITETEEGIVDYVSSCIACSDGTDTFMGELLGAKCEIGNFHDDRPYIKFIPINPE